MLNQLQLFTICATLVQCSSGAPWETNNDIKEFDLEWQCEQFCNRLKGDLIYNSTDSACTCTVGAKADYDPKHLEHKLTDLGLNFKIVDKTKSNIIKRETPLKKLLAEKNQKEAPLEAKNNEIGPDPESEKDDKPPKNEQFHRLRSKLLLPRMEIDSEKDVAVAPDALDTKDNTILGQDDPSVGAPKRRVEISTKLVEFRKKISALKSTRGTVGQKEKNVEPDKEAEEKDEEKNDKPDAEFKKPPQFHLNDKSQGTNTKSEAEKSISEKIRQMRERIQRRLQARKACMLKETMQETNIVEP